MIWVKKDIANQDCLVDIIITMNKNCKGGTDMAQQKEGDSMGLFKKKNVKKSYDRECMKPVIRASICTGEQVAGFKDMQTGKLEEIMLIKSPKDLDDFKNMFGITEEIEKEYWMRINMQRADKNYKDLKQKQKSVIADKTYSMYSDFSLLQVTLPEVHHMVSPGKKWGWNHGKIWKKMSKQISVKNLELYQKNSKTYAYVHAV
jgi:uncharacterized protein YkvS